MATTGATAPRTVREGYCLFLDDVTDGVMGAESIDSVCIADLVCDPRFHASLAFHAAWEDLYGIRPCKPDVRDFVARISTSADGWRAALQEALLGHSPLRVLPNPKSALESALDAYSRAIAAMKDRGRHEVMRRVAAKLVARFSGDPDPAQKSIVCDGASLIKLYKQLTDGDATLALLESWASIDPRSSSASNYYARLNHPKIRAMLDGSWSFLTDAYVTRTRPSETDFSALDLLRHPMVRDTHLWRTDLGGRLVCGGLKDDDVPCIRRAPRGMPPELVARALPPNGRLYSRIVVSEADAATFARYGHGGDRLVSVDDGAGGSTILKLGASTSNRGWWIPPKSSDLGAVVRDGMIQTLLDVSRFGNPQQHEGFCHFQQFIATYVHERSLMARRFDGAATEPRLGTVLVCDTRENWWTLLCLLVTLDHLDASRWRVVFVCSSNNDAWARKELLERVPWARVVCWDEVLGGRNSPFSIGAYNRLMTSEDLWTHPAFAGSGDHVLTVQDDGAVVRRGLETDVEMLAYDYVGAPWVRAGDNAAILTSAGVSEELVGNGGVSLRKRSAMLDVIRADARDGRRGIRTLFCRDMMPVPEDVYFSARVGRCAPRRVAERFSYEECLPSDAGVRPYAFHKPWAYLPAQQLVGMGLASLYAHDA